MKFNRKHLLLGTTAVLGLLGGIALGQVTLPQVSAIGTSDLFQLIPNGVPTAQSMYASLARMRSAMLAGTGAHTGTPVIGLCGTSGGTIAGNDYAFQLTQGTAAETSCVATFSTHFNTIPVCTAQASAVSTANITFAITTANITITQPSTISQVYQVHCIGQTGG